jgi:curved DNA-binding protein CbpA
MTKNNKPTTLQRPAPPPLRFRSSKASVRLNHKTINRISLLPPAKERWNQLKLAINDWLAVLDESTYYELLSLDPQSPQEDIQKGFHEFSLAFHPDRHREAPQPLLTAATTIFKRGVEAYGVLRRAQLRSQYDIALARGQLRLRIDQAEVTEGMHSPLGPQTKVLAVAQLCKTPAGRLHARQAERSMSNQQGEKALELLEKSLFAEGTNRELEEAIEQLRMIANRNAPIID